MIMYELVWFTGVIIKLTKTTHRHHYKINELRYRRDGLSMNFTGFYNGGGLPLLF